MTGHGRRRWLRTRVAAAQRERAASLSSRCRERDVSADRGHRAPAAAAERRSPGVGVFLQAVQDLGGGGGRSANSQYQYTLLGDDLNELRTWSQKLRIALQDVPEVTDVDTDLQPGGLETDLIVDRDSASRLGLTASQIDNTLGDAFAQAQVSTIYNPFSPQQYHVVMEVAPEFWQNPDVSQASSTSALPAARSAARRPLRPSPARRRSRRPGGEHASAASSASVAERCGAQPRGQLSGQRRTRQHFDRLRGQRRAGDHRTVLGLQPLRHRHDARERQSHRHLGLDLDLIQPAGRGVARAPDSPRSRRRWSEIHMPVSIHGGTYGTARLFQQNASSQPLMLLAALAGDLRRAGHAVRELQPAADDSLDAALGRSRRPAGAAGDRHGIQPDRLPGILLLIGIVKKNAIMMVDFALDAERNLGLEPARGHRTRLLAALPADHDDDLRRDRRRACRWPSPMAMARRCAARWASRSSADWSSASC